jgi:hypothetical protein
MADASGQMTQVWIRIFSGITAGLLESNGMRIGMETHENRRLLCVKSVHGIGAKVPLQGNKPQNSARLLSIGLTAT